MTESAGSSKALGQWVRSALAHFYDAAYLQTHLLSVALDAQNTLDLVTRAQRVRRVLLDCIEALRPAEASTQTSVARVYAILTYRYIDGLSMEEIGNKLSLSRRQTYREHEKGLDAITSILEERYNARIDAKIVPPAETQEAQLDDPRQIAQAEVSRLQQTVRLEPIDAAGLLRDISTMLAPLSEQTGITIRIEPDANAPQALADRVMLRQALINLLTLGMDMAAGEIVVQFARMDDQLSIDLIANTPDDASRDEPGGDLRLGLAVAQSLVQAQGGRLALSSAPNCWQATLMLPSPIHNTLLVIDDNDDMVALFRRYLGAHRIAVVGVSDSSQAWRVSAELQPRIIVLDVMMPNLDGWEMLQRLKRSAETQRIPVIVCSVLNEARLAMAMGASGYLTKPVNQTELLAMTQRWFGVLPVASV